MRLRTLLPAPVRALGWRHRTLCRTGIGPTAAGLKTLKLLGWTLRELRSDVISFSTTDGVRFDSMAGNLSGLKVYLDDYRDPAIQAFITRRLGPGSVFVDVGANIGTYAVRAGQLLHGAGRVIAIEAASRTFDFLKQNVALNGLDNVLCLNLAIGDGDGTARMRFVTGNAGETHVATGPTQEDCEITLQSLDAVLRGLDLTTVDYVKVDVEGYELSVLKGARQTIAANPNIIVQMELIERHLRRYGHSIDDVATLAMNMGLKPHRVEPDGRVHAATPANVRAGGDILWSRAAIVQG